MRNINTKQEAKRAFYNEAQQQAGFMCSDKVRVIGTAYSHCAGWGEVWHERMNDYVGCVGDITFITRDKGICVHFGDGNSFCFPFFVLEVVEEATPKEEPKFKPFQQVLMRHSEGTRWEAALYSDRVCIAGLWYHRAVNGGCGRQCVPFEGNEYLLGTKTNI